MSIQYPVLGLKPTTTLTRVSSLKPQPRAPRFCIKPFTLAGPLENLNDVITRFTPLRNYSFHTFTKLPVSHLYEIVTTCQPYCNAMEGARPLSLPSFLFVLPFKVVVVVVAGRRRQRRTESFLAKSYKHKFNLLLSSFCPRQPKVLLNAASQTCFLLPQVWCRPTSKSTDRTLGPTSTQYQASFWLHKPMANFR